MSTNEMLIKYKPQSLSIRRIATQLAIVACFLFVNSTTIYAIARGYKTNDDGLQTGMVVSINVNSNVKDTVERASQESSDKVIGVVTTIDTSLITVGSAGSTVLVENEGKLVTYVSDINGGVRKGDRLVLSPLKGVLMKALPNGSGSDIAIAATDPADTTPYPYTVNNQTKQTEIAKIEVNFTSKGAKSYELPKSSLLTRLGRSLVGKEVSELQVVLSIALFFVVLIVEGTLLYGAISSSLTALGRNPLARKVINGELLKIIALALLVLGIGLGAVYVILLL